MPSALIVDDSPDLRRLLTRALTNEGMDVVTAENGQHAIEMIPRLKPPCVVLLDLMMPIMDGFEFLKWKVNQPGIADWPVIILSASTHSELPKGATAYLKKPVNLDELLDLIEASC